MTIADKLKEIAENTPKIYEAGKQEGIEQGKQAEYDAFWDAIQDSGKRTNYYAAFGYSNYPLGVFKPKYPLKTTGGNRMFVAATIELADDEYLEVDLSECTDIYWMFRNCKIKRIGKCDLTSVTAVTTGAFSLMSNTVEIKEIVSSAFLNFASDMFNQSTALEKVIFSGEIAKSGLNLQWSTRLSKASYESIRDHVSLDVPISITFSLAGVNKTYETSEGANDGSTSGEWVNLWKAMGNVTIALA